MCSVWISEQTVTSILYIINRLVFISEVECVFSVWYALSPYITQIRFVLKGFNSDYSTVKLSSSPDKAMNYFLDAKFAVMQLHYLSLYNVSVHGVAQSK
jgi:hypothetical protein